MGTEHTVLYQIRQYPHLEQGIKNKHTFQLDLSF